MNKTQTDRPTLNIKFIIIERDYSFLNIYTFLTPIADLPNIKKEATRGPSSDAESLQVRTLNLTY